MIQVKRSNPTEALSKQVKWSCAWVLKTFDSRECPANVWFSVTWHVRKPSTSEVSVFQAQPSQGNQFENPDDNFILSTSN